MDDPYKSLLHELFIYLFFEEIMEKSRKKLLMDDPQNFNFKNNFPQINFHHLV